MDVVDSFHPLSDPLRFFLGISARLINFIRSGNQSPPPVSPVRPSIQSSIHPLHRSIYQFTHLSSDAIFPIILALNLLSFPSSHLVFPFPLISIPPGAEQVHQPGPCHHQRPAQRSGSHPAPRGHRPLPLPQARVTHLRPARQRDLRGPGLRRGGQAGLMDRAPPRALPQELPGPGTQWLLRPWSRYICSVRRSLFPPALNF